MSWDRLSRVFPGKEGEACTSLLYEGYKNYHRLERSLYNVAYYAAKLETPFYTIVPLICGQHSYLRCEAS